MSEHHLDSSSIELGMKSEDANDCQKKIRRTSFRNVRSTLEVLLDEFKDGDVRFWLKHEIKSPEYYDLFKQHNLWTLDKVKHLTEKYLNETMKLDICLATALYEQIKKLNDPTFFVMIQNQWNGEGGDRSSLRIRSKKSQTELDFLAAFDDGPVTFWLTNVAKCEQHIEAFKKAKLWELYMLPSLTKIDLNKMGIEFNTQYLLSEMQKLNDLDYSNKIEHQCYYPSEVVVEPVWSPRSPEEEEEKVEREGERKCNYEDERKRVDETKEHVSTTGRVRNSILSFFKGKLSSNSSSSSRSNISLPSEQLKSESILGEWDVFLSHTQGNGHATTLATDLYYSLKLLGFKVWFDVKMKKKSTAAMEEGVRNSKVVIAIITGKCIDSNNTTESPINNAYFKRPYCVKELEWAIKYDVQIQPIVQMEDKKKIGKFLDQAPQHLKFLGKIDFIDLNKSDEGYWNVGVNKIIKVINDTGALSNDTRKMYEESIKITPVTNTLPETTADRSSGSCRWLCC